MPQNSNLRQRFNPGTEIFSWVAHDYHPHERGIVWIVIFCLVFFGGAVWSWLADPKWGWITSLCLLIVAGFYFWVHRREDFHKVVLTENGILIDNSFFYSWEKFEGFWFVYDETVAVINFQFANSANKRISLQMGEVNPDQFREIFAKAEFPELSGMKESLADLWARALKL